MFRNKISFFPNNISEIVINFNLHKLDLKNERGKSHI